MLHLKPLTDDEADDSTRVIYQQIRDELELDSTPLFFQYIGRFPKFLQYFWTCTTRVLNDATFKEMVQQGQVLTLDLFKGAYNPSSTAIELVTHLLKNSTSEEFIRSKIEILAKTNITLALIFVASREAVKGWAISTRLLSDKYDEAHYEFVTGHVEREVENSIVSLGANMEKVTDSKQFDYVRFMAIVQSEMDDSVKKNSHLYGRLELEEFLVRSKDHIFINLSYPILAQYAYEYKYFDELVYLMSESFPTISTNRIIASCIGQILLESKVTPGVEMKLNPGS